MKYLFINSVAGFGSTGRIAAEQCRKLMAQGHQCVIAYGRQKTGCDDIPTVAIGTELDYKLHGAMNRLLDNHGFGSKAATRAFLKKVREYDPDVIWLHNVHGYYIHLGELFSYLKESGKKIYWTLHDCWSFTGHCAHFEYVGCEKWKTGCHDCPQKREYPASMLLDSSRSNYARKKELFTGIPDLTLIVPSRWLGELVKESFLGEYPVQVCYNSVDPEIFRPTPGDFRRQHGLEDRTVLLGVASVWTERKGLGEFAALARLLDPGKKLVLVGVTAEQEKLLPPQILCIRRTNSVRELAQLYTAADVLINPTLEDTYPTVNLEALACGTPVISYRTGGSPESLDPTCGIVVDRTPEAILRALEECRFDREACLTHFARINRRAPFYLT